MCSHIVHVANLTLAIPDDLLKELRRHSEINWSEVTRRALRKELERMHVLDSLLQGSQLTESDAVDLGRSIRRG
jgi:hypothetical protein